MGSFNLITRDGASHVVAGRDGVSLMQTIRDAGFTELLAMCGGCLSCATCHVYLDALHSEAELPTVGPDEDDLLDGSDHRMSNSRLSCQIPFNPSLAGMTVRIAPRD